jgi:hypothetical protein
MHPEIVDLGYLRTANSGNNSVSEFNNTGAALSGAGGYALGFLKVPVASTYAATLGSPTMATTWFLT